MGEDFWPYGIEKNRRDVETFVQYCLEQGLIEKKLELEDLFAKNTFKAFKV